MRILTVLLMVVILTGCKPAHKWIQEAPPPVTVVAVCPWSIMLSDGNGKLATFESQNEFGDDVPALAHSYSKGDVIKAGEPPAVQNLRAQLADATNDIALRQGLADAWETIALKWASDYNELREHPPVIVVTSVVEKAAPSWTVPTWTVTNYSPGLAVVISRIVECIGSSNSF